MRLIYTGVSGHFIVLWLQICSILFVFGEERISGGLTSVHDKRRIILRRRKRDTSGKSGLTQSEKYDSVNKHNELRRLPNAANMEFLVWNDYLADMAQDWAEICNWDHGQPYRNKSDLPFSHIGQNLYFNTGRVTVNDSMQKWYDEISVYDYETNTCRGMCGHYTQVVAADSREIGCGFYFCKNLTEWSTGKEWKNAYYYVCNYGPAGNYQNTRPYIKGPACSQCGSKVMWCDRTAPRGLCRRDCTTSGNNCECKAVCNNGGSVTPDCKCICTDGWTGLACEKPCKDYHSLCGKSPGYPKYTCKDPKFGPTIRDRCPLLCEVCRLAPSTTTSVSTASQTTTTTIPTTTTGRQTTTIVYTSEAVTTTKVTTAKPPTSTIKTSAVPATTTTAPPTSQTSTAPSASTTTATPQVTTVSTAVTEIPSTKATVPSTSESVQTTSTKIWTTGSTITRKPTTSPDPCAWLKCLNGGLVIKGTVYRTTTACSCQCFDPWQGEYCQHNKGELSKGVLLMVDSSMQMWPKLWKVLKSEVASSVNSYCRLHFSKCCPHSGDRIMFEPADFLSEAFIKSGTGYPSGSFKGGIWRVTNLVLGLYMPNNALCNQGNKKPPKTEKDPYISQDILIDAIKTNRARISNSITKCCKASLLAVERGRPDVPKPTPTASPRGGLPLWAILIIVVVVDIVIFSLIGVLICVWRRKAADTMCEKEALYIVNSDTGIVQQSLMKRKPKNFEEICLQNGNGIRDSHT